MSAIESKCDKTKRAYLERNNHTFSSSSTEFDDSLQSRYLTFDSRVKVLFSGLREGKEVKRSNIVSDTEVGDVGREEWSKSLVDVLGEERGEGGKSSDEGEEGFKEGVESVSSIFETVLSLESSSVESNVPICEFIDEVEHLCDDSV